MRSTRHQKSMSSQKAISKSTSRKKVVPLISQQFSQKDEDSDEDIKQQSQKLARTRSNPRLNKSQIQTQSKVVYSKGTYIAFVDPSDLNQFKIGYVFAHIHQFFQLLNDFTEDDDEVVIDIYNELAPLVYQKQAARQPVPEYTVICDVNATVEKAVKRGAKPQLKINKQQQNKANKHMDAVVQKIEQEKSDNDDEEDNEEEDQDEDQEEEQDEEESHLQKDDIEIIKSRRIVKAKASQMSSAKPKRNQSSVKSQKSNAKKPAASAVKKNQKVPSRSASKKSKKAGKDQDMKEDEEDEENDQSEVMIDTTSKKGKQAQKAESLPQVGQKRLRVSKKQNLEESNESSFVGATQNVEGQDEDENEEDDDQSQPIKKRKITAGKEKIVKAKAKKGIKRPTEFKKGRWNPDIQIIEHDKYIEDKSSNLFLDCCIRCNNKNIIRAVQTENEQLLKKGIEEIKKISSLTAYWSPESQLTALDHIISKNLHGMLEILMHPKCKIPAHSTYERERDLTFSTRTQNPQYLMSFIDSGMVGHMAYGTRVRKVQMTRGNRQGNNAFLEYEDNPQSNPVHYCNDDKFLRRMLYSESVDYETIQQIYKLNANFEAYIQNLIYEAVRAGNRKIAYEIIKNMAKYPNYGFNQLHVDVLSDDAELVKILKVSVTKKANTCKDITPLFCACINPNPNYLRQLLEVGPDTSVADQDLRRAPHYAAACVGQEPLEVLIKAGISLTDVDNKKINCLHVAAITGRAHNVRLILQTAPQLLNARDKKSMTAMAYACKYGRTEVVKVLQEYKVRINAGCGLARMTPLGWAAAYGHYDLALHLVDNKARTLSKDKFKRTPLIMAVRNGHTKLASLLLQRGSEWYHCDSSMNTPLHYAAGYGWMDCIDLLLKAGASINAQNSWKISPINIAMLKNHQGCVKRLLDEPNVDVNGKDEKGRTLIILSLFVLDDDTEDFISFLLRKGADPNIADLEGQTSLHYIAKYVPRQNDNNGMRDKALYLKQVEIQKKITQILIQHNADLTIKDNMKRTPFTICLDSDNAPLLEFLKDKVSINKEPDLFFAFKDKIFNVAYQKILERLMLNDPPTSDTINTYDDQGFTPFLRFVKSFSDNYNAYFTSIQNIINQQSFIYGNDQSKYNLANQDIFDKFADQTNFYTFNYNFPQEEKNTLTRKFLDQIIVQPFVKFLEFLISQGANENSCVYKLKKYRDLELQKNTMFGQLAAGEEIKINKEEEGKVLKREEKQKQMGKRGKGGLKSINRIAQSNQNIMYDAANADVTDTYDKIGGKKILREYSLDGKRNAIHLLIKTPQPTLFSFLLSLKINPDQPDYDEVTPFNLMSKDATNRNESMFINAFDMLLDLEVRIDYPDNKGRTPFLNYYDQQNFDYAYRMLVMGANVNQMDTSGLFALKYALIRRQDSRILELIEKGANINQIDNKGRNLLHHAINMSSATADATFETEQLLIDKGIDINLRDQKNRTPLHYAFVKISDWQNSTQIDPIETVSSICGCKGLELDVPDKWHKTPLHYASQRGASICAMYMIQRGADMERKDIYGNTSLGVGLMRRHYNYGIILIQKQASIHPLTHREDFEKIKKLWEEEEKKQKELYRTKSKGSKNRLEDDEDMEDENSIKKTANKTVAQKKHRNLFQNKNAFQNDYGDDYGEEDYDDEEDEYDQQDIYQETVFNQQNAFGMQVYPTAKKQPNYGGGFNAFGGNFAGNFGGNFGVPGVGPRIAQPYASQNQQNYQQLGQNGDLIVETDKEGISMFKLAIRAGQQGLAYLMLDNGYDLMHAMQDAMDEKKFMLVLTLLSKNPDDKVIQSKNSKGQNLFHILSMNASSCGIEHLKRIYDALLKRGVDVKCKDNFGRNTLHYAVIGGSLELVQMLVSQTNDYNPNEVDNEGYTPLALSLRRKKSKELYYYPQQMIKNIFYFLVKNGADVNFVYPEDSFQPDLKQDEVDEMSNYDPKGKYYTTPLINLIRQNPKNETLRNNLIGLIEFGAKLDVLDSDGRDPIMHAVKTNNTMVIKILLENKKALHLNPNGQDKAGKSAVHYVINPLRFGSYENIEILGLLYKYGFDLKLKDNFNKTPAQYAAEQESGVLLQELSKLAGQQQDLHSFQRAVSMIETQKWPELKVDFEQDAEQYMDLAHDKEKLLAKEKEFKIPVDKTGNFEKSYQVYYDEFDHPWDCHLTKVDLKNGIYGDYVFYKMQLLHDINRDLYVVFTRWGRIGERGMNQRTPFNNIDEAKQDYKKIFKQKTGGNNFDELDTFSRVKKKYNITRINYITVDFKDYLQPFDFEKCPKSRLSQPVFDLFEEISNVTMYQRAMNQFGLDADVLPFSAVKKESLVEARQILMEIQEAILEDQNLSKEGIKADFDSLAAVKEKICELSSRYYELIPLAQYKNQIAPPLNHSGLIKTQFDVIESLTNIEFASKMLLAALFRQQEMNPVDYVYQALNLIIDPLENQSAEYEVIRKYIDNTRNVDNLNQNGDQYEISNIFKFQRKGEAEMIQAYKDVPNHFLLFHGSAMYNFLGILSQGLRIAPPEAPPTGYMFGKGVYFADMFDKSFSYAARGYNQQDSYLMVMCEVVLGKSKEVYQGEYIEKLEHPYSSVKGCGRRGPGYKNTVVCPNAVKIPLGPVINYFEDQPQKQNLLQLQHNEYIVYNTSQIRMRYIVQVSKKKESKK